LASVHIPQRRFTVDPVRGRVQRQSAERLAATSHHSETHGLYDATRVDIRAGADRNALPPSCAGSVACVRLAARRTAARNIRPDRSCGLHRDAAAELGDPVDVAVVDGFAVVEEPVQALQRNVAVSPSRTRLVRRVIVSL